MSGTSSAGASIIIASRSIPAAQPIAGVWRSAELFDQPVVAAAGDDGALRAEPVGHEFERGVAVIIEPAHQPRGALPGDPGGVEPGGDRGEEVARFGGQEVVDHRRAVGDRPVAMILAVEDAQRVLVEPLAAFLAEVGAARGEMLVQRVAPRDAAFRGRRAC